MSLTPKSGHASSSPRLVTAAAGVLVALVCLLSLSCSSLHTRLIAQIPSQQDEGSTEGARWQKLPVHYCLALTQQGFVTNKQFRGLVEKAFAAWGVKSVDDGDCGKVQQKDGKNEIGWGVAPQPSTRGRVYEAGYTSVNYRTCTGTCPGGADYEIVEADISIDPSPPKRTTSCLYTSILHEVGHLLGLPHLDAPSVMQAIATECRQELTPADKAALAKLYPGT